MRNLLEDNSLSVRKLTIYFCNLWEKLASITHIGNRINASAVLYLIILWVDVSKTIFIKLQEKVKKYDLRISSYHISKINTLIV